MGYSSGNRPTLPDKEILVTIVTVVLNGEKKIEETLSSIFDKVDSSMQVEVIVVDGGSTDRTVEVIERFGSKIDFWVSEPDQGIYDAINKAISFAKGFFVYVLNVGDTLLYLPLNELGIARQRDIDLVIFNVKLSDGTVFNSDFNCSLKFRNTVHHQGAFYKRSMGITYNLKYRVFADYDLNLILYKQKRRFIKFEQIISYHSLDGVSNKRGNLWELYSLIRTHSGSCFVLVAVIYFKVNGLLRRISNSIQNIKRVRFL